MVGFLTFCELGGAKGSFDSRKGVFFHMPSTIIEIGQVMAIVVWNS